MGRSFSFIVSDATVCSNLLAAYSLTSVFKAPITFQALTYWYIYLPLLLLLYVLRVINIVYFRKASRYMFYKKSVLYNINMLS